MFAEPRRAWECPYYQDRAGLAKDVFPRRTTRCRAIPHVEMTPLLAAARTIAERMARFPCACQMEFNRR